MECECLLCVRQTPRGVMMVYCQFEPRCLGAIGGNGSDPRPTKTERVLAMRPKMCCWLMASRVPCAPRYVCIFIVHTMSFDDDEGISLEIHKLTYTHIGNGDGDLPTPENSVYNSHFSGIHRGRTPPRLAPGSLACDTHFSWVKWNPDVLPRAPALTL